MSDIDWNLLAGGMAPVANPVDVYNKSLTERDTLIAAQQKQQADQRVAAAQAQAGSLYGSGDTRGATAVLIGGGAAPGMITATTGADQQDVADQTAANQQLAGVANAIGSLPYANRAGAIAAITPHLINAHGYSAADIAGFDPTDDNLQALTGSAIKPQDQVTDAVAQQNASSTATTAENGAITANAAQQNADTTRYTAQVNAGHPVFGSAGQTPYFNNVPAPGGMSTATGAPITAAQLYQNAIKPLESGGQPNGGAGAVGQATQYGTAIGSSQMLPATAQAMAAKLGVAYRPDLMAGTTPQALQYQDQLGTAYAQTALDASGGDAGKALAFYYGGPNMALHGPKTAAYVQNGLAKLSQSGAVNATAGQTLAPKPAAGSGSQAALDPTTIDNNAWQYIASGTMPALGMGSGGARSQILNRVSQLQAQYHISNDDIVRNKAASHSDNASLSTLQKQFDLIVGNEGAVKQNFQQWLAASRNLPDPSGLPVTQSIINPVAHAFGNTSVGPADLARRTAVDEYARVMTGGASSSGHTTDSATKNYDTALPQNASIDQKTQIVNQALTDMQNRKTALAQQIAAAQQRLAQRASPVAYGGKPAQQTASNAPAGGTLVGTSRKTGRPVYRLPNGAMVLG